MHAAALTEISDTIDRLEAPKLFRPPD